MPVFLIHHLKHNRVLHERVLLVSVLTLEEPRVEDANRVEVIPIGAGISRVILRYGFMETPDAKHGAGSRDQPRPSDGRNPERADLLSRT